MNLPTDTQPTSFGRYFVGYLGRQARARWLAFRAWWLNSVLTFAYGQPVKVMPAGNVGVAGAVVFWYLQGGFKQFVMVRSAGGAGDGPLKDGRARFISSLGFGGKADMGEALRSVIGLQFGKVFERTIEQRSLAVDRVAAAPVFMFSDEANASTAPIQTLVWCIQIQEAQVDLIQAAPGLAVVVVPEFGMSSTKVSATHRGLWQSVQRHLPKDKVLKELTSARADDTVKEADAAVPRVLH